jgi:transaldolase
MIVSQSVHVDTVMNRSGSSWARHSVRGPWAAESSANVPFADLGGVLVELAVTGPAAVHAEDRRRARPIERERERQREDGDAGVGHDLQVLDRGEAVLRLRPQRGDHRPDVGPGGGDDPLAGLIMASSDGDRAQRQVGEGSGERAQRVVHVAVVGGRREEEQAENRRLRRCHGLLFPRMTVVAALRRARAPSGGGRRHLRIRFRAEPARARRLRVRPTRSPHDEIFLDTADIDEIRTVARWGILDGVTTNPTLYSKVGGASYEAILQEICKITPGPVSAEVVAEDVDGMLTEGRAFAKLAPNIVVKVPMSEEGLEAMSRFASEGIKTNCTLIFTANQGLLAAKAGASLLSPFVGRLDDINQDGMIVIRELVDIVTIHELETEVLAASIRNPLHMTQAALAGAHIATLPFKVLQQMVHHPLTTSGIVQFRSDWEKAREALAAKKGD